MTATAQTKQTAADELFALRFQNKEAAELFAATLGPFWIAIKAQASFERSRGMYQLARGI